MDRPKIKSYKDGPERKIQEAVISMLQRQGWFVKETHGNMFSSGFPDLFASHSRYGMRWIEIKCPTGSSFTTAQMEDFPKFSANGAGIWVLTAATESEYLKLWLEPNWGIVQQLMNPRSCNIPRINARHQAPRPTATHRTVITELGSKI